MYKYSDTNKNIVSDMVQRIGQISVDDTLLEPSAGTGLIIKTILEKYTIGQGQHIAQQIDFCELDAKRATQTTESTGAIFKDFDFIRYSIKNKYSIIIAVPPFDGDLWEEHIQKMYEHLKPKGRMIVLLPDKALQVKDFIEWMNRVNAKLEFTKENACNYSCITFILEVTKSED